MKYEYHSVVIEVPRQAGFWTHKPDTTALNKINNTLNLLGKDGWQLVGVFPITDGGSPAQISMAIHYFSRPLAE